MSTLFQVAAELDEARLLVDGRARHYIQCALHSLDQVIADFVATRQDWALGDRAVRPADDDRG